MEKWKQLVGGMDIFVDISAKYIWSDLWLLHAVIHITVNPRMI